MCVSSRCSRHSFKVLSMPRITHTPNFGSAVGLRIIGWWVLGRGLLELLDLHFGEFERLTGQGLHGRLVVGIEDDAPVVPNSRMPRAATSAAVVSRVPFCGAIQHRAALVWRCFMTNSVATCSSSCLRQNA